MLRVENLSKRFGDTEALKRVSFTITEGQVYSLLGPNGAGKTTTLRIVAGLMMPDTGQVLWNEYPSIHHPEVKRQMGYLTADMGLYPRLTPWEYLNSYGRFYGLRGKTLEQKVREVMSRFGIEEFAHRRCESLSTGMKQRVLLARTLLHDPILLILDEPTAGLDAITALDFISYIREEKKKGKCILFSTHQLWEAEIISDALGILHCGNLVASGTPSTLLPHYGVASLLDLFVKIVEHPDAH